MFSTIFSNITGKKLKQYIDPETNEFINSRRRAKCINKNFAIYDIKHNKHYRIKYMQNIYQDYFEITVVEEETMFDQEFNTHIFENFLYYANIKPED